MFCHSKDASSSHYAMTLSLIVQFMWSSFGLAKILSYMLLTRQLEINLHIWCPKWPLEVMEIFTSVLDRCLYWTSWLHRTWHRKLFLTKSFQLKADLISNRRNAIMIEAENSMIIVERYHDPFRRACNILKNKCPTVEPTSVLQMAVKIVSDSFSLEGINPTLAVYGAISTLGLVHDSPSPSTYQRSIAVKIATVTFTKHFTPR